MCSELVSMIMPVWKPNIHHLRMCIDSILRQTYENFELNIIYKKSNKFNKEFFDLISSYKDKRIVIIEDENKGFTNALNQGIINSNGKYIARMDADDFCNMVRIEHQLKYKKKTNCDIIGSWGYFISNEGKIFRKLNFPVSHHEIRKKMMLYDPILHPSVLTEKKIIEKLGLYDTSFTFAEDYELWFRAISKGYRFGNVPEYLIYIRNNPNSITRGDEWKKARVFNIKAKNKALFNYGFISPRDLFYHLISTISYLVTPEMSRKWNEITRIKN